MHEHHLLALLHGKLDLEDAKRSVQHPCRQEQQKHLARRHPFRHRVLGNGLGLRSALFVFDHLSDWWLSIQGVIH